MEVVSDPARVANLTNDVPEVPDELKGDFEVTLKRRQLLQRGRIMQSYAASTSADGDTQLKREYLDTLSRLEDAYDAEARRRHAEEQRKQLAPREGTEKGILGYFDFPSVAGQGPEFVLRFTALVTIIFAVIALSILGLLNPDQAGTILAAIAGYVLGQASARIGRGGGEEPAQSEKGGKGGS